MRRVISLKAFYSVTGALVWIGYVALAGIVLTVLVDASGRYLFNHPMTGGYELVQQVFMMLLGGFAILYATMKRGHVAIDLLLGRFPKRAQPILRSGASFLALLTWAVMAYTVYRFSQMSPKETTPMLRIPIRPLYLALIVGTALSVLTSLIQTIHPQVSEETPTEKKAEIPDEH